MKCSKYLMLATLLASLSFSSCDLERLPLTDLSEENFWNDEKNAELALTALYRIWPLILLYFFILAVIFGQVSMGVTLGHMRRPYVLSFIRGLDGLAAGSLSMIAALIGVMILVRLTRFFGERYGKL